MAYKMVHKKYNIMACRVTDLSEEVRANFQQQKPGQSINDFTIFYDSEREAIVMNQDREDYKGFQALITSYMTLPPQGRLRSRQQVAFSDKFKIFSDALDILEYAISRREQGEDI